MNDMSIFSEKKNTPKNARKKRFFLKADPQNPNEWPMNFSVEKKSHVFIFTKNRTLEK